MDNLARKDAPIVEVVKLMRSNMFKGIKGTEVSGLLDLVPDGVAKIMIKTTIHDINNSRNVLENIHMFDKDTQAQLGISPESLILCVRNKLKTLIQTLRNPEGTIDFNQILLRILPVQGNVGAIEVIDAEPLRKFHGKNISMQHAQMLMNIFDEIRTNMGKYGTRGAIRITRDNNNFHVHVSNGLKDIHELADNLYSGCEGMQIIRDNLALLGGRTTTVENIYNGVYSFGFSIPVSIFE